MQSILRLTAYVLLPLVVGCSPSFLITPVSNTNAIQEVEVQPARGWFAAKIGIYPRTIKSGALKEMGSPFKPISTEEKAVMQGMIDEYYTRFVSVVQTKCHISDQMKLTQSTDGRVFSGEQALAMGLIDRVGMLEDAIDLARKRANAPTARVIMYKRPYGYSGSIYAD